MSQKVMNGLDLNAKNISNMADASAATDAVTLQQLQALVRGLSWKDEVKGASTANLAIASAVVNGLVHDGVTYATGESILLKDQSAPAENGIYVIAASGAASRRSDADSTVELENASVFVSAGTANQDKAFTQTATVTTPGTTAQAWVQFGGGTSITAGNGLTGTTTISVLLDTASGLVVSGSGLKVDIAVVVRKFAANCAATTNPQTFTDNLGTLDKQISVVEVSTGKVVIADCTVVTTNTFSVDFGGAPTASQYRVIAQG